MPNTYGSKTKSSLSVPLNTPPPHTAPAVLENVFSITSLRTRAGEGGGGVGVMSA